MPDASNKNLEVLAKLISEKEPQETGSQIFISHSRRDINGKKFFQKIFSQTHTAGFWYSDNKYSPPHAKRIIEELRNSSSLFVILSPEMVNSHTSSWVSFEVGVAKALNLKVWAFENPSKPVKEIPLPGVDAYIQRPSTMRYVNTYGYKEIIEQGGKIVPRLVNSKSLFDGDEEPELINNPFDRKKFDFLNPIECPYEDCKHTFFGAILHTDDLLYCPACRQTLIFSKQDNEAK